MGDSFERIGYNKLNHKLKITGGGFEVKGDISGSKSIWVGNTSNYISASNGNLTVTGQIVAKEFKTEFVSASILYASGSTKFGDTSNDVHSFTGSLNVSGGLTVNSGNARVP